mmetsp:Transcript_10647/g.14928  ORF Transcript_10647/g.14928 Transcript_10647/m.14928 type:complete len:92 (-) Transcript_10647:422-697(-)
MPTICAASHQYDFYASPGNQACSDGKRELRLELATAAVRSGKTLVERKGDAHRYHLSAAGKMEAKHELRAVQHKSQGIRASSLHELFHCPA